MTGTAVLLLVRPIVRHRDRFAQSEYGGDGWRAWCFVHPSSATIESTPGRHALPWTGIGHAGPGFGRRQRLAGLQQLDGDAIRRADESHTAVTRRSVDRHAVGDKDIAGVVDVVHGVCEMPEI